jgi:phytanoyl-CoA hydroxylase
MRAALAQDEIDFYRENGFLAVPDLLDADELAVWRAAVDDAVAQREREHPELAEEDEDGAEWDRAYYRKVFSQSVNLWQTSERVRGLMLDERLGKLAADLAGVDAVRIWHDQALVKQPYANYTAFHLDVPYWSFRSADALSMWVALDDATLENGCLYYVPGSHKAEKYDNVGIGKDLGALFDVYPEWRDVPAVACPVPAGGACFHNGLTFPGAGANMTPGQRRAMTCGFMPDGCTFNGQSNILPPSYLEILSVGDVLDDDRQNPLVFSR